jgi:hypothetical protein
MEENKMAEILKQYLKDIHINDNDEFFIVNPLNNQEIKVSRKYLEESNLKKLLNYRIVDVVYPYLGDYNQETLKFYLKKSRL